jgi:hypothetical protein
MNHPTRSNKNQHNGNTQHLGARATTTSTTSSTLGTRRSRSKTSKHCNEKEQHGASKSHLLAIAFYALPFLRSKGVCRFMGTCSTAKRAIESLGETAVWKHRVDNLLIHCQNSCLHCNMDTSGRSQLAVYKVLRSRVACLGIWSHLPTESVLVSELLSEGSLQLTVLTPVKTPSRELDGGYNCIVDYVRESHIFPDCTTVVEEMNLEKDSMIKVASHLCRQRVPYPQLISDLDDFLLKRAEGLFLGHYGPFGHELISVYREPNTGNLVGLKLTGDDHVPSNQLTFRALGPVRQDPPECSCYPAGCSCLSSLEVKCIQVLGWMEAETHTASKGHTCAEWQKGGMLLFYDMNHERRVIDAISDYYSDKEVPPMARRMHSSFSIIDKLHDVRFDRARHMQVGIIVVLNCSRYRTSARLRPLCL